MSNDPFGLTAVVSTPVTSSDLESLGKRASLMYLEGRCSLNDAVVKVAQERPGITSEQVNRVVEYANQLTHAEAFTKQAGDKNVEFPIADPHVVASRLDNVVNPMVVKVASDYAVPPPAVSRNRGEDPVKVAFSVEPKDDGLELLERVHELDAARQTLEKAASEAEYALHSSRKDYKECVANSLNAMKQHVLQGGSMPEMAKAASQVLPASQASILFDQFQGDLEYLASVGRVDLPEEMAKVAHAQLTEDTTGPVNPEHPLVDSFASLSKVAEAFETLMIQVDDLKTLKKEAQQLYRETKDVLNSRRQ